jgi:hypothetical protein
MIFSVSGKINLIYIYIYISKTKFCSKCGVEKNLSSKYFYKSTSNKTGFESTCKFCRKILHKTYRSIPEINEHKKNMTK